MEQTFPCSTDICRVGEQFCETDSMRCRYCYEFKENCYDAAHFIYNCSQFCLELVKKNVTEVIVNKCKEKDAAFYLNENHHFLIEGFMTLIIIVFISYCVCPWPRFLLNNFFQKIFGNKATIGLNASVKYSANGDVDLPVKEPLVNGPEVKVEVDSQEAEDDRLNNLHKNQYNNCGFMQHNQMSTATDDQGMVVPSGYGHRGSEPT